MIKIPQNYQIIFYAAILIFSVLFFFYFYRQASVNENGLSSTNVVSGQTKNSFLVDGINLNFNFFSSEKFRNLRSSVAPTVNFKSGKRNPFLPE
jgi:hypothetical protein